MEDFSPTQFFAHPSQKSSQIWNDCISRNGYRIKITHPNLMILVSFSFFLTPGIGCKLDNDKKMYVGQSQICDKYIKIVEIKSQEKKYKHQ